MHIAAGMCPGRSVVSPGQLAFWVFFALRVRSLFLINAAGVVLPLQVDFF